MFWEGGGLSWGSPLRGLLLSGQAWSYFMSFSFGTSTPRMLQACCAATSSEGQAEHMGEGCPAAPHYHCAL